MKRIWSQYSYAIILIVISFALTFIIAEYSSVPKEEYVSITVIEGDSLWKLAEQYAEEHQLSPQQFIHWVKKNNKINDTIFAGDSLIVPIKKEHFHVNEFASANIDN